MKKIHAFRCGDLTGKFIHMPCETCSHLLALHTPSGSCALCEHLNTPVPVTTDIATHRDGTESVEFTFDTRRGYLPPSDPGSVWHRLDLTSGVATMQDGDVVVTFRLATEAIDA